MGKLERVNISQQLTSIIADQIIRDERKSGEPLYETALSREFKVSRSPVRDALHQLEKIRLVERAPKGVFMVANLTYEMVLCLYDSVNIFYQYAFAKAAMLVTQKDLRLMNAKMVELEKSIIQKNFNQYLSNVTGLAQIILRVAGNPFVEQMAMELMPTAERVQWKSINCVPDQLRIVVNHLNRGFLHIASRNPDEAAKAFRDFSKTHIEVVLNSITGLPEMSTIPADQHFAAARQVNSLL